jgi:CrcB protein
MTLLLVAVGAAVGAPLRYLVDRAIQARHDAVFPCGTFTVNVTGSLILGALAGAAAAHDVPGSLNALVGVGLCGALTTYSTFGYETIRLVETGARALAALNALASVIAALGAAVVGAAIAQAIWP